MTYKPLKNMFYIDKEKYNDLYSTRYNSESTYRFDFNIKEHGAFVVINNDILQSVEAIMELDCDLLFKMNSVPPIALQQYAKKCLIDEIKMTNEIEGVISTRKEISEIINDKIGSNKRKRMYGLVKKYELLIDEDIKLTDCEDIRNLYNELVLKEVVEEESDNEPDGIIFRKEKVYVQDLYGKIIHSGVCPEIEIINHMSSALNILNNDEYNFLIRIAVFHYMFGYIHPFYDGNGRISRFISSYLLSRKLNFLVSYRLAYTIKKNIESYYKSFKEANDIINRGDLTIFVIKFLNILIESLKDLCASLDERHDKLNYFQNIVTQICGEDKRKSDILFILVQNTLFGEEGLSVEEIYEISGIGKNKIRDCLKEMLESSILYITKVGKRNLYDVDLEFLSNS